MRSYCGGQWCRGFNCCTVRQMWSTSLIYTDNLKWEHLLIHISTGILIPPLLCTPGLWEQFTNSYNYAANGIDRSLLATMRLYNIRQEVVQAPLLGYTITSSIIRSNTSDLKCYIFYWRLLDTLTCKLQIVVHVI